MSGQRGGTVALTDDSLPASTPDCDIRRYDTLLPDQPRKANSLAASTPSHPAPPSATRSVSPLTLAGPRDSNSTPAPAPGTTASVSAGGGSSHTSIRIKFANEKPLPRSSLGGKSLSSSTQGVYKRDRPRYDGQTSDEEEADQLHNAHRVGNQQNTDDDEHARGRPANREGEPSPELKATPNGRNWGGNRRGGYVPGLTKAGYTKRDRRGELARREARKRLGLPPRTSIEKHLKIHESKSPEAGHRTGHGDLNGGGGRRESVMSYGSSMSGAKSESDDESDDEDEATVRNLLAGGRASAEPQPVQTVRKKRKAELIGTFFASRNLRDSVVGPPGTKGEGRRSSARVVYAFGQRLPEVSERSYLRDVTVL